MVPRGRARVAQLTESSFLSLREREGQRKIDYSPKPHLAEVKRLSKLRLSGNLESPGSHERTPPAPRPTGTRTRTRRRVLGRIRTCASVTEKTRAEKDPATTLISSAAAKQLSALQQGPRARSGVTTVHKICSGSFSPYRRPNATVTNSLKGLRTPFVSPHLASLRLASPGHATRETNVSVRLHVSAGQPTCISLFHFFFSSSLSCNRTS